MYATIRTSPEVLSWITAGMRPFASYFRLSGIFIAVVLTQKRKKVQQHRPDLPERARLGRENSQWFFVKELPTPMRERRADAVAEQKVAMLKRTGISPKKPCQKEGVLV